MEKGEFWQIKRRHQRERRKVRLHDRRHQIIRLKDEGFEVESKTEVHYRINRLLDIWLVHNQYHDIENNKRGEIGYGHQDIYKFVKNFFKERKII